MTNVLKPYPAMKDSGAPWLDGLKGQIIGGTGNLS